MEVKSILTKVYGIDPAVASQQVENLSNGPLSVLQVDSPLVVDATHLADQQNLDLTDAVLLKARLQHGATQLATEDKQLSQVSASLGVTPVTPFDAVLRNQVSVWETAHLPPKGLIRILRRIDQWLNQKHPSAATDFRSQTANGTQLP